MRRVSSSDVRRDTEWLTGLVRTMDAVTRGGACSPIDNVLRDRFSAHVRQAKPVAPIPLTPIDEEARAPHFEDAESR